MPDRRGSVRLTHRRRCRAGSQLHLRLQLRTVRFGSRAPVLLACAAGQPLLDKLDNVVVQ